MPGLGQPISMVGRSPLELLQLSLLGSLLSTTQCLDHKDGWRSFYWESQQHPSHCNRAPSFKINFLPFMKYFFKKKKSRRRLYEESACCTLCLQRSESLMASSSDPSTHIMLGYVLHAYNPSPSGSRDNWNLGAHWSHSLAQIVSSRFRETLPQNIRCKHSHHHRYLFSETVS